MLKRIGALELVLIFVLSSLSGCQKTSVIDEKYKEIDYSQIDFANEKSDFEKREKEIVILTEESIENEVSETALWYMRSQDEVKVIIQTLSNNEAERMGQLQELRTEIMAGEGPDVYLLETAYEETVELNERELLFANVNKSIESGFFEDLSKYMEEDSFWKEAPVSEAFMKAGQMNGKQYVLPLSCYYYVLAGKEDEVLKMGENIEEWMNTIRFSGNHALLENCGLISLRAARLLQPAIDYEKKETILQKEAWISLMMNQIIPYKQERASAEYTGVEQYSIWQIPAVINDMAVNEYTLCEVIPGLNGEKVAAIHNWGAVSRSCDYKQNAYDFLMLFLNNYVSLAGTENENGLSWYPGVDECIGMSDIPVHTQALQQFMERKGIKKAQRELIIESFEQVDYAYFSTEVESFLFEQIVEKVAYDFSERTDAEWRVLIETIADMAEEKYEMLAKE